MRGLRPGGGAIPLINSAWRCEHSAPDRNSYSAVAGTFETVSIKCKLGAHSFRSTVLCYLEKGAHDRQDVSLDGEYTFSLNCAVK